MATGSDKIIRLFVGSEILPDQQYDDYGGRSYYFIQDSDGNRYTERGILPDGLWSEVMLTPLSSDDYGLSLDDGVSFE